MRLIQSMADRKRYRVMTSCIYDRRQDRIMLALIALLLIGLVALMFAPIAGAEESEKMLTVTLSSGTLNVREKPSGHVIACLYDGDTVTVESEKGGWAYVTGFWEAGKGYVMSCYLTDTPDGAGEYQNATAGRVRIRREPDGKATGWLKNGAVAAVTAWRGGWAWVGNGWVKGECLEVVK